MKLIVPDEGYYYGLGIFETIGVEQGKPLFLENHFARFLWSAKFLGLEISMEEVRKKVYRCLQEEDMKQGRKVIKVTASQCNLLVDSRENLYDEEDYQKGFITDISHVRRNETSPFTYHKTLNYGECIHEKRSSKVKGVDEPVFLNTKGAFAEGASSNLFFIREGRIVTPPVSCGLLPGVMRSHVLESYAVKEQVIYPEEMESCEEMFLTNSLLGIMPVRSLGAYHFPSTKRGRQMREEYQDFCRRI